MILRSEPDVSASARPLLDSIAQAAAWCAPRADMADPRGCLRTPALMPPLLYADSFFSVRTVVTARRYQMGQAFGWERAGRGRLMVNFPDADLCDGAAELETGGWFDGFNAPPWDTWVGYFQDDHPADSSYGTYLLAWVPPACEEMVGRGIHVNPEQCIAWLEDTDCAVRRVLEERPGPIARLFGRG